MGANRTRKHKITLYLSDNEYTMLIAKTKITRMRSMSQTLRCLLISADLYDIDLRYVLDHNTLLAKIGNNLNQIAKYVNTSQEVTMEQYQEVRDIMKQILDLQIFTLSASFSCVILAAFRHALILLPTVTNLAIKVTSMNFFANISFLGDDFDCDLFKSSLIDDTIQENYRQ